MATIRDLRARFSASTQGFRSAILGVQEDMDRVGQAGEQGANQANEGFANLKSTLLGFAGAYLGFEAITGAVGGIIGVTDQYQQALNTLQTKTGATTEEMEGMSESLKNIYGANYGADFADIAESMSLVGVNTGLTGKALEESTKKAIVLRDAFQLEIADSTKVADTMMKNFGITADEAFELMAQGSQNGMNKAGDMLDTFDEYGVYFKQLGFDAEGMWNVMDAGMKAGVRNTDVIGDTIKEFGILAKDGSDATAEAFKGLGMDAGKMAQEIAKGGPSAQKAMEQTFQALGKIEDPVKRNALGVSLFGTMFEDLEHKAVLALGNVSDTANKSGSVLAKVDAQKYNNIGSAMEGLKRTIIVSLLEPIEKNVMPAMSKFVEFMQGQMPAIASAITGALSGIMGIATKLAPTFANLFTILTNVGSVVMPIIIGAIGGILAVITPLLNAVTGVIAKFTEWAGFGPLIVGLATAFGTYLAITKASVLWTGLITKAVQLWTIAQRALNLVMAMNPIALVVSLLVGLVAGLIYAYQTSETFRNIVNKAWSSIKTAIKGVIDWAMTTIPIWIDNIVKFFKNMGAWIADVWQGIKDGAVKIWEAIKTAVMFIVEGWIKGVKAYFELLKTGALAIFNGLKTGALAIWNGLKTAVMAVVDGWVKLVKTVFNGLKTAVISIFNALKSGALAVWNAIKSAVTNAVTGIKNTAVNIFNALKSGVVNTFNALKSTVVNVVNGIKNGVSNAFQSAKSLAISAFNALKNGIVNIVNGVKNTITGMKDKIVSTIKGINLFSMGKDMMQGLINGIKNMASKVVSSAKGVVDGAINGAKKLLGINSPSRVFMEFGQWTGEGLAIGIDKMKGMVADATGTLADASIGTINDAELNPLGDPEGFRGGQVGHGGTNYNAPLMNIENYHQNDNTDVRSISNGLYNLQRNSDRKKGR